MWDSAPINLNPRDYGDGLPKYWKGLRPPSSNGEELPPALRFHLENRAATLLVFLFLKCCSTSYVSLAIFCPITCAPISPYTPNPFTSISSSRWLGLEGYHVVLKARIKEAKRGIKNCPFFSNLSGLACLKIQQMSTRKRGGGIWKQKLELVRGLE